MKKGLISAFVLVMGSVVLGATVLQEPIARAAAPIASVFVTNDASNPVPVREQNLDANGNIKVREQGVADVNVTNGVSVSLAPVTGGGGRRLLGAGVPPSILFETPQTATGLSIGFNSLAGPIIFRYQGAEVASFWGPRFFGSDNVDLALTRPITFDEIDCQLGGPADSACTVSWIGNQP